MELLVSLSLEDSLSIVFEPCINRDLYQLFTIDSNNIIYKSNALPAVYDGTHNIINVKYKAKEICSLYNARYRAISDSDKCVFFIHDDNEYGDEDVFIDIDTAKFKGKQCTIYNREDILRLSYNKLKKEERFWTKSKIALEG